MNQNAISWCALSRDHLEEMSWLDLMSLNVDPLRHLTVVVVHLIGYSIFLPSTSLSKREPISNQLHHHSNHHQNNQSLCLSPVLDGPIKKVVLGDGLQHYDGDPCIDIEVCEDISEDECDGEEGDTDGE